MHGKRRWDPCVAHRGDEADAFVAHYFAQSHRRALLVAGAGFDPRSRTVATRLSDADARVRALFIQEKRPDASRDLLDRAGANMGALCSRFAERQVEAVDIFSRDGAAVGGRNVINVVSQQPLHDVTDVVIDASALSTGTSFPIIRYFAERTTRGAQSPNVHVFVVHDPQLDGGIRRVASDAPGHIHGFKGGSTLSGEERAARLWLPQLALGANVALRRLYSFVAPHDTCPILPFPADNPRLGDELAEAYLAEFEEAWSVDARNIVYADEGDPLDLYRTILRLDDRRKPVFAETGGSMLVLSPMGSKVTALGALLAALERDLPIAYLETVSYELEATVPEGYDEADLIHLWLEGDVYPQPRPSLLAERDVVR